MIRFAFMPQLHGSYTEHFELSGKQLSGGFLVMSSGLLHQMLRTVMSRFSIGSAVPTSHFCHHHQADLDVRHIETNLLTLYNTCLTLLLSKPTQCICIKNCFR